MNYINCRLAFVATTIDENFTFRPFCENWQIGGYSSCIRLDIRYDRTKCKIVSVLLSAGKKNLKSLYLWHIQKKIAAEVIDLPKKKLSNNNKPDRMTIFDRLTSKNLIIYITWCQQPILFLGGLNYRQCIFFFRRNGNGSKADNTEKTAEAHVILAGVCQIRISPTDFCRKIVCISNKMTNDLPAIKIFYYPKTYSFNPPQRSWLFCAKKNLVAIWCKIRYFKF